MSTDSEITPGDEEALFGASMSTQLADELAQSLEGYFSTNVPTLPMLLHPDVLLKRLRNSYLLHVDILEHYCQNRIFAIAPFVSKKRRISIAQELKRYGSSQEVTILSTKEQEKLLQEQEQSAITNDKFSLEESSAMEGIASEAVEQMKQETLLLQKRLQRAQQKRATMKKRLDSLSMQESLTEMGTKQNIPDIHSSLLLVATQKTRLNGLELAKIQLLEEEGHFLFNTSNDKRGHDQTDILRDMVIDVGGELRRKKNKTMSLEERYEQDKQMWEKDGPYRRLVESLAEKKNNATKQS